MTYYTASGNPGQRSSGSSAAVRSEFSAIQAAFATLPAINGSKGFTEAFTLEFTPTPGSNQPARMVDIPAFSGAPLNSPTFTGNPTAPTPSFGDNDTSIATTAFVQAALAPLQTSITNATNTANTASSNASTALSTANAAASTATNAQNTANSNTTALTTKLTRNANETTTGSLTVSASAVGSTTAVTAYGNSGYPGVYAQGGVNSHGVIATGGSTGHGVVGYPGASGSHGVIGYTFNQTVFGVLGAANTYSLYGNGPSRCNSWTSEYPNNGGQVGFFIADGTDLNSIFLRQVSYFGGDQVVTISGTTLTFDRYGRLKGIA